MSVRDIAVFAILLFLYFFVASFVGIALLKNHMLEANGEKSRFSFDTLGDAMITTFQCLTKVQVDEVIYAAIRGVSLRGACFILLLVLFGCYVLETMFLVILLTNMEKVRFSAFCCCFCCCCHYSIALSLVMELSSRNIKTEPHSFSESSLLFTRAHTLVLPCPRG